MKLKTQAMPRAGLFLPKNLLVPKLVCPILMFAITASAASKPINHNSFKKTTSITNIKLAAETITGTITDDKGQPLPGVTIKIKNATTGTTSDVNGKFTISVPDARTVLTFSMIGFETQEIVAGNSRSINITLKDAVSSLDEVVVVGYGEQKRATLTGSVATVSGREISQNPSPNVAATLAGKLPGLIVTQRSGEPGRDDPGILIRGNGTTGDSSPLIVIDGVPGRGSFSRLNAEDIESISVLKDGSAAIYGNRAANGVILVTTKKGTKGKPTFNLTYNYGIQNPTKIPDVMDAAQFAEVYNETMLYRGSAPFYTPDVIQKYRDGSDPVLYPNSDWVDLTIKSAVQQRINLQMSGGSDNSRYLVSFGKTTQGNNFKNNPTASDQYNFRAKLDVDISKYLSIGANINAIIQNRTYSPVGTNVNFVNILQANPTLPGLYPNGLLGGGRLAENPLLLDRRGRFTDFDLPLQSTFTAAFKVPWVPGLRFDVSYNYDFTSSFDKSFSTPYTYHEYNATTGNYDVRNGGSGIAELTDTYSQSISSLYNYRMTYEKTFGPHHILAMVGGEQQQQNNRNANAYRRNFLSTAFDQINFGSNAPADIANGGSAGRSAYNNYFGRVGYDFESKYIFEFVFRYDGSQNFAPGKRYGFFPGVSGVWRVSEEKFFKAQFPFVDNLRLRATYGSLGSDRVGSFQYAQFFGFGGNYVFGGQDTPGINTQTLPNPNFSWETSRKTDLAINGSLWKGLLSFEFIYFMEKRTNLLQQRNFSASSVFGFSSLPPENIGKVDNKGYEIELGHRNNIGKLTYNVRANFNYQRSTVVFIDEVPRTFAYQNATGHPVGAQLLYQADGIFNTQAELDSYPHQTGQKLGDVKIIDLNGDGVINQNDQFRFDYNNIPKYTFGMNMDFQYKNFDLNISVSGQLKAYTQDGAYATLGNVDFSNASVHRATDRWTPTNPNGTKPRADAVSLGNNTFFMKEQAFARIKSLEFGYTLPTQFISKIKISSVRLFANAFNLLTWSKEIKWADPEANGYVGYPPVRTINFGANIRF
jgi:TonB-linked SusC/RagA family outer membrane protein